MFLEKYEKQKKNRKNSQSKFFFKGVKNAQFCTGFHIRNSDLTV